MKQKDWQFMCRSVMVSVALMSISTMMAQGDPNGDVPTPIDTSPQALASYEDFARLVEEVGVLRPDRLVDLDTFLRMQAESNTVVLDTRSREFYQARHIDGAINLPFTEFTQANLRALIPDTKTRILIYCNNNFSDDQINFMSKMMIPESALPSSVGVAGIESATNLFANQTFAGTPPTEIKPILLALNIPTFINLYGYGYLNVYELNELVSTMDARVSLVSAENEQL